MGLLNHSCLRIKYNSINILYYFLSDIDIREQTIKNMLLKNKNNFEKYFSKLFNNYHTNLNSEYLDISEKSSFILYQLERLENMC